MDVEEALKLDTTEGYRLLQAKDTLAAEVRRLRAAQPQPVDIVFDGPPGPESGRFVEVESPLGKSIKWGEWVRRSDGYWALRIPSNAAQPQTEKREIEKLWERAERWLMGIPEENEMYKRYHLDLDKLIRQSRALDALVRAIQRGGSYESYRPALDEAVIALRCGESESSSGQAERAIECRGEGT